jgi:hypothetical protein
MNANELADMAENACCAYQKEIATMLRQQQAEIEALKMDIHSLTYGERFAKYFNKPVAWIDPKELDMDVSTSVTKHKQFDGDIPLYTHPYKPSKSEVDALLDNADYVIGAMREEIKKLKTKTLTDEEIQQAYVEHCKTEPSGKGNLIDFARAILKKASEK